MIIDALQYVNPSPEIFNQMAAGGVDMAHITVGYHEDFSGVVDNLAHWARLIEDNPDRLRFATNWDDIDAARAAGQTALFFGLQNPLAISADISRVETLYRLGIRFCQITYNQQSLLGAGCFEPHDSGLTVFGREVVDEMNRLGMVIDLSHAGHKTAMDVVEYSKRPVTVTHANPYYWHAAPRNLRDELLAALDQTGGMVGFSLYPHHLDQGSDCSLENFAAMVGTVTTKYRANMWGIGSDLCQNQPDSVVNWMRNGHWRKVPAPPAQFPQCPAWFSNNADYPAMKRDLATTLPADVVDGVMGLNWYNFLKSALTPKDRVAK